MYLDLNCDIGEEERVGSVLTSTEDALLNLVTSVNVACGYHAGGHNAMAAVTRAAAERGVAIGAHPGLADRAGFGRTMMAVEPDEVYRLTLYQLGALAAIAHAAGAPITHVKPHGGLYHMAEADDSIADAIVRATNDYGVGAVVGLSGGRLVARAEQAGLRALHEVFIDRGYRADGTLIPRGEPGAIVDDPQFAADRLVGLLSDGIWRAVDGTPVRLMADTACIHGDGPHAVEFASSVVEAFRGAGIVLQSPRGR